MILLYGATGYTGRLVAASLAAAGLRPTLAGRRAEALAAVAAPLGLDVRAGGLGDLDLRGATALLNCAGPFALTQAPLLERCLAAGVHYLDLAGEADEHAAAAARDGAARAAGVLVLPGAGFGIVPSDCLVAGLLARRPAATRVDLALKTVGGVSRGSAEVILGGLRTPGVQRVGGVARPARAGAERLRVDFGDGDGPGPVVTQPWRADVVTVPASVPDVRTYMTFPAPVRALMRVPHGPVLRAVARRLPEGPPAAALARGRSAVWARVTGPDGTATGTVTGPDAYVATALAAAACLRRVLAGDAPAGVHSPAGAWGPDLLADVPELTLTVR